MSRSDSQRLSQLLDPALMQRRSWLPQELGAILRHQLTSPIEFDVAQLPAATAGQLRKLSAAEGLLLKSLGELLTHPNPPLELLVMVKQFAKANRHHPDAALPEEVATVIYLASIVVALVRYGQRITEQDDAALRGSIQWVLSLPWIGADFQTLFREGLEALASRQEELPDG